MYLAFAVYDLKLRLMCSQYSKPTNTGLLPRERLSWTGSCAEGVGIFHHPKSMSMHRPVCMKKCVAPGPYTFTARSMLMRDVFAALLRYGEFASQFPPGPSDSRSSLQSLRDIPLCAFSYWPLRSVLSPPISEPLPAGVILAIELLIMFEPVQCNRIRRSDSAAEIIGSRSPWHIASRCFVRLSPLLCLPLCGFSFQLVDI